MPSASRAALPVFFASCVAAFLFFWLGSVFVSTPQADVVPLRPPTWDEAKWWLGRPDTGFYIDIAENGYKAAPYSPAVGTNWAFFPAYPLLLRLIAHGRPPEFYLVTGLCLSLIFYGLSVLCLARLLLKDYDEETVTRTLLLFCFYPFAFSLAVFGPDSLLLLTVCAAFYYARQSNWIVAALAAAIACVTRVQGILVVPCVIYLYLRQQRPGKSLIPLLLSPIGLIAFAWHLRSLTGNPVAFIGIQSAWNNTPSYPFAFLVNFLRAPALINNSGWDPAFVTVIVTCAMLPLAIWAARKQRIPIEYSLFFALQLIVLTCRTSTLGNLRYVTGCFPFLLACGIAAKRTLSFALLLAIFAAFFGLFAALFATGQQHHPGYHFAAF